jgi:uncharacterized protein YaaQ
MKMILAIVDDARKDSVSQALLQSNFRVTQLATTSGFLRGGATTLMIGVEDDLVEGALQIIRSQIARMPNPDSPTTLYVLNVKSFNRL